MNGSALLRILKRENACVNGYKYAKDFFKKNSNANASDFFVHLSKLEERPWNNPFQLTLRTDAVWAFEALLDWEKEVPQNIIVEIFQKKIYTVWPLMSAHTILCFNKHITGKEIWLALARAYED